MKKQAIYKLVKLDTTFEWDEKTLKDLNIKEVHTWYIFDSLRPVNCCEIMPSYDLLPVYCAPNDEWDMPEEKLNEFNEIAALNPSDDSKYVHCISIDPIATELPSEFIREYEYDEESEIDESWENTLEASDIFNQGYLHLL